MDDFYEQLQVLGVDTDNIDGRKFGVTIESAESTMMPFNGRTCSLLPDPDSVSPQTS